MDGPTQPNSLINLAQVQCSVSARLMTSVVKFSNHTAVAVTVNQCEVWQLTNCKAESCV